MTEQAKENRLAREKSPYLLQHAKNPVDWYPWGEEAFARARAEDKPLFVSIGYATCHWCHVMERESFEDPEVAEALNRDFVAVKVDREERPDVDQVYMAACQALNGSGGWPLSVFVAPDGRPFFAGTYFPKTSRARVPGFLDVLAGIARLWKTDRDRVIASADNLTRALAPAPGEGSDPDESIAQRARDQLARNFDEKHGGFGVAPKFPSPHNLEFLLCVRDLAGDEKADAGTLRMVDRTLSAMRRGGIWDHVGFGIHRYSVDAGWLVPHFEKMLYDQALVALAALAGWQAAGNEEHRDLARRIFTYVLRDMTSPEGGFCSAEDADSEGEEGRFYVWTPAQVAEVLGPETAGTICKFFRITDSGNFEKGVSIPNTPVPSRLFAERNGMDPDEWEARLEEARSALFAAREKRVHPLKDDKILTAWNGLMIAALARGSWMLNDPALLAAAGRAAAFIEENLTTPEGGLLRRFREGEALHAGFLEDYAAMVRAYLELYGAGFDPARLARAVDLADRMVDLFWDAENGGFFFSGKENESLVARPKELYDGAMPSGNSMALDCLFRLSQLTGRADFLDRAEDMAKAFGAQAAKQPLAYTHFLAGLLKMRRSPAELVIVGGLEDPETRAMIREFRSRPRWNLSLLLLPPGEAGDRIAALAPFAAEMKKDGAGAVAYLCQNHACQAPVTDAPSLAMALSRDAKPA